ncbi:MAG TPA: hypothetical protein VFV08_00630, partial [Puia sp.]|nr:hypothetical protein [Puia sp.]
MKKLRTRASQLPGATEFPDNLSKSRLFAFSILILGGIAGVLASAKWHYGLFAWMGPLSFLYYFRISHIKRKVLWFFLIYTISSVISAKDVAPFPFPVLFIVGLIQTFKATMVYLADRWIVKKSGQFFSTLFFPAASVSLEFLGAILGNSIWFSVANSQFSF